MRKGTNPARLEDIKVKNDFFHQIIVPVYLPELTGYYEQGLDILKICLDSICMTVHKKTFISVVNNGSCEAVKTYLDECLKTEKIQEVIHTTAIGKINAIAKGISGHDFDLVTITDADVLFVKGWQKAVYDIYETFPKAGMVGTTPNSKMWNYLTENIHFDNFFSKKLKFRPVSNPDDMLKFDISVGKKNLFKNASLYKILSIKKEQIIAVVGTGHFVATYKSSILQNLRQSSDHFKISPDSDNKYLDIPSIENGHWRLSTYKNYTYHIGNQLEDWVLNKYEHLKSNPSSSLILDKPIIHQLGKSFFCLLRVRLFRKLFFNKYVWKRYLRFRGLNKQEAKNF